MFLNIASTSYIPIMKKRAERVNEIVNELFISLSAVYDAARPLFVIIRTFYCINSDKI